MVTLRYGFDNPETIKLFHKYLYQERRFQSFEEAKNFITDLPTSITVKIFDCGEEFITELETNCYILCEGRKIPQIKGKTYEIFEYFGSSKFRKLFCENRFCDFDKRNENNKYVDEDYITWFRNKFINK